MDSYEAWLAAMPVDDVRRRIAQLEQELAGLRALVVQKEQRAPAPEPRRHVITGAQLARHRKLSRERKLILDVVQGHPDGASPRAVAEALRERGLNVRDNAVQTNMGRMVEAGQLVRLDKGRYRIPEGPPPNGLLNGSTGAEG